MRDQKTYFFRKKIEKQYMLSPYLLTIIILNTKGLNSPIQRQKLAEWKAKKKAMIQLCALYKRLALDPKTHRLKEKGYFYTSPHSSIIHNDRNKEVSQVSMSR